MTTTEWQPTATGDETTKECQLTAIEVRQHRFPPRNHACMHACSLTFRARCGTSYRPGSPCAPWCGTPANGWVDGRVSGLTDEVGKWQSLSSSATATALEERGGEAGGRGADVERCRSRHSLCVGSNTKGHDDTKKHKNRWPASFPFNGSFSLNDCRIEEQQRLKTIAQ